MSPDAPENDTYTRAPVYPYTRTDTHTETGAPVPPHPGTANSASATNTTPPSADTTSTAPPADYRILLPEGWFRLHVEPGRRERSVDALLDRRFAGVDDAPHIKRLVREKLLEQAAAAFEGGGIELYLSLQEAGPLTIPASLLISLLPPRPDRPTPLELAAALGSGGTEASVVDLPAGTAVRTRRTTGGPDHPAPQAAYGRPDESLPSVTVDFQVPVPGTNAHLLLTFSTPLVQIAEAMVELFDAVAASLAWTGAAGEVGTNGVEGAEGGADSDG
ncbi:MULTISPECIES: hypothetical protein [unclassified Streptomyces]|uniref:hypothetical protein n=1 Tax=unclassified Streptomyces TaxID=2593676 RepID=UPI003815724A